jgi:hypothetical protein
MAPFSSRPTLFQKISHKILAPSVAFAFNGWALLAASPIAPALLDPRSMLRVAG